MPLAVYVLQLHERKVVKCSRVKLRPGKDRRRIYEESDRMSWCQTCHAGVPFDRENWEKLPHWAAGFLCQAWLARLQPRWAQRAGEDCGHGGRRGESASHSLADVMAIPPEPEFTT
jgi:hypothetical protein